MEVEIATKRMTLRKGPKDPSLPSLLYILES